MNRSSLPRHPFPSHVIAAGTGAVHASLRTDNVRTARGLCARVP